MALDLSKGQQLQQGHKISLSKGGGPQINKAFIGAGWDMLPGRQAVDLDLSAAMFDANKGHVDTVWFGDKKNSSSPIYHSGDNLTGAGDGDDEVIALDLSRVPANVQSIVFTITSYRGHTFDQLESAFVRFVDRSSGQDDQKAVYKLAQFGRVTALVVARLYRHNGEWKMQAVGAQTNGKTVQELIREIQSAHL